MDLSPFKLDIDELLADYTEANCTAFTDFKRMWMAKKFSYIYEDRPKTNSGAFMQSLFLHCIGHKTSQSCLPQRLAGLYCLYCLYESQPYKPHFKIYLSLEELKKLKDFVVEAKQNGMDVVPALVKRMLDKGMILFGFINLLGNSGAKQVSELTASQNKRVQFACDKLFLNTQIESNMHMDLGSELELDKIKKSSTDYAKAKELAFAEASQIVDVEDARHIVENDKLLGDRVEEIVKEWDSQKEMFYEKTRVRRDELAIADHDESAVLPRENDDFDEIRQLLLE
ncbi:hypothetical protein E2562_034939 [Oryza meyeriana var. granulata]|uniref:Small nuclear RNA activating complex (SNAPc), subunit SNAP43 protein n=1 Tax=Oryza meyeriana var. granulata TaxID=110450 RepID=A0A6G1F1J7_9ORYZ|nr:hypothetical protein E2562_034939 [Oryza meyeriana var. granulata]KAF0930751.1 hypothetical protein E2562_034939 [Oryza meyeriana var. granulata]KAF0930754.1 hypothetical protein E2562_034939 [Oryza meyeriana var. granulata]